MSEADDQIDPLSDPEERQVLYSALDSFRQYRTAAHYNITHLRRQSFYSLSSNHINILSESPFNIPEVLRSVDEAIESNAELSEAILSFALQVFGVDPTDESWKGQATPHDLDKARSTIRQFWRDWSAEGRPERQIYLSVAAALAKHVPLDANERHGCSILVPGAGLGRLVFDLCCAGYVVEGNEISYHQLMASNYILNCTRQVGQHILYPWALSFSNLRHRADQLQAVGIPDIHPAIELESAQQELGESVLHYSERMSMSAGDFCEVYQKAKYKDAFQAVVTCFFVDTSPNPIRYVETILHCLASGGVWINVGPLLWHFESGHPASKGQADGDNERKESRQPSSTIEPGSVQLTDEEIIALVARFGFEVLEHGEAVGCGYIQQPQSMLLNLYRPSFWVARKN